MIYKDLYFAFIYFLNLYTFSILTLDCGGIRFMSLIRFGEYSKEYFYWKFISDLCLLVKFGCILVIIDLLIIRRFGTCGLIFNNPFIIILVFLEIVALIAIKYYTHF